MGSINEDISVMVIGAGSGGRLIAQGLRKTGIPCTVFEQDESLDQRSRDWDFGIYWAQTPLESCLPADVRERIIDAQVDNVMPSDDASFPMFNGATGEVLNVVPTPNYLRLRRREFARVMGRDIDIRYNKRLASIDTTSGPGVTATFEDGTQHTATVLVGAEGAHSPTREYLLGSVEGKLLDSPFVNSMLISTLPADRARDLLDQHHRICALYHPNGTFMWMGVHDANDKQDPSEIEFVFMCGWKHEGPLDFLSDSKTIIRDIKRRAQPFAQPFRAIAEGIDENRKAWSNYLPYWPTRSWDDSPARGKVTLAGDAAHPMTPHRGQGLNNAILDCDQFVKQVEAMPERTAAALHDAVKRYEAEMVPRGNEAALSNLENSHMVHDFDRLMRSPLVRSGVRQTVEQQQQQQQQQNSTAAADGGGGKAEMVDVSASGGEVRSVVGEMLKT